MKTDSATKVANGLILLDEVVPRYLALSELSLEDGYEVFNQAFSPTARRPGSAQLLNHLKDQWYSKERDFGMFYLNLDFQHQRMLLEYWDICVGTDPYSDDEQRFLAILNGDDFLDVHCFETEMLHRFLLMAVNNSLNLVHSLEQGEILQQHFERSQLDTYGNSYNWGKFYLSLCEKRVLERTEIIRKAVSYR